ncbi:MAG: hypothetical protein DWH78_07170 [Planctomycetota bacterium]|nr:MAG: hypothetical protein DWH78_07170 [Planctomycetota bacterium]
MLGDHGKSARKHFPRRQDGILSYFSADSILNRPIGISIGCLWMNWQNSRNPTGFRSARTRISRFESSSVGIPGPVNPGSAFIPVKFNQTKTFRKKTNKQRQGNFKDLSC